MTQARVSMTQMHGMRRVPNLGRHHLQFITTTQVLLLLPIVCTLYVYTYYQNQRMVLIFNFGANTYNVKCEMCAVALILHDV